MPRPSLFFVWKWLAIAAAAIFLAWVVWSVWDHAAVMGWIERARPLPFFSALAVLPAFGLPVGPLFVLAGASFGRTLGVIGSLIALAINLIGCYWVARRMRPRLESLLRRFDVRLPDISQGKRSPIRFALTVKLAPGLPAFVKNYMLGLTGIRFRTYFLISMLITGVYAVLLVVLGESLLNHKIDRTVWVVLVVVALAGFAWWAMRRRSRQARAR